MTTYFDYAATTSVCPEAAEASYTAMTQGYGNPSSGYALGQSAVATLKEHRAVVATCLGCLPQALTFTSCGTEGNNWAIFSGAKLVKRHGQHIITTAVEHSAVLAPIKALESQGWAVTYLKPDRSGHISVEDFTAALRPDTTFISMMLVNNETGCIFPVADCAKVAKANNPNALFHCDAVQGFLKIPFTPKELGVDFLTISGHKVRAPKGIGALYIRDGLKLPPLLMGGNQENGLRSGTEPTAQIAALAAACQTWDNQSAPHTAQKKAYALERLSTIPQVEVISPGDAPHICAISLPGYPSEMLVRDLSDRGIFVSSGSACHRGKASHVFAAMGLPKRTLMGMLRISFSPDTTGQEIDILVDALHDITKNRIAMR